MADGGLRLNTRIFRRRLLEWYQKNKRDLPWRRTRDPYCIWVSEIMLQQTRVAAVIPYYERFLSRFPDAAALAAAPEQELLAAWAGLGYYTRARNLQKAAKQILELGTFPCEYASIQELPGVGDYTAAAVASIAFNLKHAALDGNVMRVLSRLTAQGGNIASRGVREQLRETANLLIDPRRPGEFNQALMELGATVCLPKDPKCAICPVAEECEARRLGRQREFPVKAVRPDSRSVEGQLLVIEKRGKLLVWQRSAGSKRLAGFWELPEPEQVPGAAITGKAAEFRHTIVNTHYSFVVYRAALRRAPKGFQWMDSKKIDEVPFSTTAKKAMLCLQKQDWGVDE